MGMYDVVKCEYPLPDGHNPTGEEYQTKDTPAQLLDTYRIAADGRLEHELYDIEDQSDPKAEGVERIFGMMTRVNKRFEGVSFHGALVFYTSNVSGVSAVGVVTSDNKPPVYREYVALFKDGQLIDIRGGVTDGYRGTKHYTNHKLWMEDSEHYRESLKKKESP